MSPLFRGGVRSSFARCSGVTLAALLSWAATASAQTMHQALLANPVGINDVGIRYFNSGYDLVVEQPWVSLATDGKSLLIIDKSWENEVFKLKGGALHAFEPESRFAFVGSGIDLLHIRDNAGEPLEWEIVDGGSGDTYNVVASGVIDTYTPGAPFLETVHLAPQGSLSVDKIHMLRTRVKDTDNLGAFAPRKRVFIDAFAVYDEVPLNFDDNSNFSGNWTYSPTWEQDLPDTFAYEGGRAASSGPGETIDFNFTGTSLVVYGFAQGGYSVGSTFYDGVSGVYNWEIDGGAGGSGTVDQSLDDSFSIRWPEILVNGLSAGPHTLKITAVGSSETGGDYNGNGFVDAADYVLWRNNFGASFALTNENPVAGTPGIIDQEDYDYWVSRFGNKTFSGRFGPNLGYTQIDVIGVLNPGIGSGAAAVVPEPTSANLGLVSAAGMISLTRRRFANS